MFIRTASKGASLEGDAAVFGISPEFQEQMGKRRKLSDRYELHEDIADIFFLFQHCQGSWNITPTGGLIGLNKSDVTAVATAIGVTLDAKSMALLTVCETAYIKEFNKRRPPRG